MMKRIIATSALIPALSLSLYAIPALADDDLKIIVKNDNSAYVKNDVDVNAKTGNNDANGGYAGGAGNGGDVTDSDDDNTGGNGGNGGNGGDGGFIDTGNATAKSLVVNKVNTNKTDVDLCGCATEGFDDVTLKVKNYNRAKVKNYVDVDAKTGNNDANGGNSGGGAGNGGNVSNSDDDNTGGNGGNEGDGGSGGVIFTGHAKAKSKIVNRVNTNITRVPPSL